MELILNDVKGFKYHTKLEYIERIKQAHLSVVDGASYSFIYMKDGSKLFVKGCPIEVLISLAFAVRKVTKVP